MDKLASKLGGGSSSNKQTGNQQEDYLDKGLDAAEKKYGGSWGQDTEKHRAMNEKITDTAREKFESMTGKDVPDKFSN
ncbi:hypothetical protein BFW01_g9096 [Lasiodiplodia theobromae]|uniref:Uncharacterized protein n=1 Tax=Lasiodiplodia theobromae TaxID=45133 RepID=A0A5N5DF14_9PEZI|nr:uncharacterized protein LTHEOB_3524 [Lasiodiplodia theobromae]KAB2576325.1 hypothetical protein DBV05_g5104 [Lasiodiplodia theobromae]KAF4533911.1 hypothetical protein LTHEOB_3524 [Lasiodiplodia theobromae]KAF9638199.1 hypothetical protein BFW01_g9096 [Lasiodiplodia theobromae]